jgi:hypothetical protein
MSAGTETVKEVFYQQEMPVEKITTNLALDLIAEVSSPKVSNRKQTNSK